MKRYITLFYLVLCLVMPTLSHGTDMTTMVYDQNEQSVEPLNIFSRVEISGPYQFRVLKDAVETRSKTKDLDGRVFTTTDGVSMIVQARQINEESKSLDDEMMNLVKERTVPAPTVKMLLPFKHDVKAINNDGVHSLFAEFLYGSPLNNRTDMVLVTDYDGTRYYYRMKFYRGKLPKDIKIEQLRQMIMDVRFVNHTI